MSPLVHLLQALQGPLLVDPRFGATFARVLTRHLAGERFDGALLHAELGIAVPTHGRCRDCGHEQRENTPPCAACGSTNVEVVPDRAATAMSAAGPAPVAAAPRNGGGEPARIAVIPIQGVIAQKAHSLGSSTEAIRERTRAALDSRSVDAILFDVDSPGGTVNDVPELAAELREGRKVKPMAAVANGLAASAAYWLAAAAGDLTVAPSGEVGSIGVYTIHEDYSKSLAEEGITVTGIAYGEHKLEGAPWLPLSEEFKAVLQERVDEVGGWFDRDVARDRHDTQANVRANYGQGRVFAAEQAVKANLADRVGTFDDALVRLAGKVERGTARGSRAWRERELDLAS